MPSPNFKDILTQIINDLGQTLSDNHNIEESTVSSNINDTQENIILDWQGIEGDFAMRSLLWDSAILHARETAREKQKVS